MLTNLVQKVPNNFICESCDYMTSRKSQYDRHVLTAKHLKLTNVNNLGLILTCKNCNKEYKSRVGLWKHEKICEINLKISSEPETPIKMDKLTSLIIDIVKQNQDFKDLIVEQKNDGDNPLIVELLKQNQEFKELIIEQNKNMIDLTGKVGNTITNNSNSHNKTFNLQVFLNETCKDAMNIMDFADSIKLQLTDLENVGEQGFVNGISNIIIKNLREMDVNLRPVHCSDLKREVAYVKENGKWEKDTPDNKLIKKAIKRIAHRNVRQIPEWRDKYPDCRFSDSKKSDQYNELIIEAMGGRGDNDTEKANKIVKKIIKNVVIDKNML